MPWLDEAKKYYETSENWFTFSAVVPNTISLDNTVGISDDYDGDFLLTYFDEEIELNSNKTYVFKHEIEIQNSEFIKVSHFLEDDLIIYKPSEFIIGGDGAIISLNEDFEIDTTTEATNNIYCTYYRPRYNKKTSKYISYWLDKDINLNNTKTHYIKSFEFEEIDFYPNGFKKNTIDSAESGFSDSNGWFFRNNKYSFFYKSGKRTPSYLNNLNEPFIAKKIESDFFNIEFTISHDNTPDTNFSLDLHLIDDIDYDNWFYNGVGFTMSSSNIYKSYTTGSVSEVGLNGRGKYLVLKLTNYEYSTGSAFLNISDIKITGTYDETINNSATSSLPSLSSDYSFEYEITTGNTLNSYIGNGKFLSGVWEDGVWNNGLRDDDNNLEFVDVSNAYPISDGKWRIELKKSSLVSSTETNLIGKFVSVGNIVAININEERKLLKNSYLVVDALEDYIVVEAEFLFPIRRIEKDSNKHRIKVSENIWLSGAFLNGRFNGIWNNGIFKGNPYNNVMEDTQWIDGTFDGGRFISNYDMSGSFEVGSTFSEIDNVLYTRLSLSGIDTFKLNVDDEVYITNSENYNGNSTILEIDNNDITIDKEYVTIDSGTISILISDGLIQNFTFNDNNLSKSSSVDTISNDIVFKYNSWIDVNYDEDSAVNIGRDVRTKDAITGKVVSKNNLYGYPTHDVLSSVSKFRNSTNLNSKFYNLGTKYKIYTDFIGNSSSFDEPFDMSNLENFYSNGWTFSLSYSDLGLGGLSFSRTEFSLSSTILEGKELFISATAVGGVLDNTNVNIENSRYSLVEFDVVDIGLLDGSLTTTFIDPINDGTYPILNLSNINYEGPNNDDMIYLPIFNNVNLLDTPNSKKVEYFFNKRNLFMDIKGYGDLTNEIKYFNIIIDNLKFYEVDMIPFFKYFNINNIYKGVQIPLEGTSPFIDFTLNRYPFIESNNIPFDSIDIKTKI